MATFNGSDTPDSLTGTNTADDLYGNEGDDTLYGAEGDDSLFGGIANDSLYGDGIGLTEGAGYDTLNGGDGNDYLYDDAAGAELHGDAGNDQLELRNATGLADGGDDQDQILIYQAANSTAQGGAGDDTITGEFSTALTVNGGDGNDRIIGLYELTEAWTVSGGLGNDTIALSGTNHMIDSGEGDDLIDLESSGPGTATITTGTGTDVIRLSMVALEAGLSAPVIQDFTGGAGGDRLDLNHVLGRLAKLGYDYSNPFTSGWLRLQAAGADTQLQVMGSDQQWWTLASLLNIQPSEFSSDNFVNHISPSGYAVTQNLEGGIFSDNLEGWDGHDTLTGNNADDLLDGGFGGNDNLQGGEGNDSLFGFSGADVLDGGNGNDQIFGGAGNDLIQGGSGNDGASGPGEDVSQLTYKGTAYFLGLYGEAGNDTLDGGAGNDYLYGGAGSDSLLGGFENDSLWGDSIGITLDAGYDTLQGGDGNDYLYDDAAGAELHGDAGDDQLELRNATGLVDGGADQDQITLYQAANSTVVGGAGDDTISAEVSASLNVSGGDGNDRIIGLYELTNAWTVSGGLGNDTINLSGDNHLIDGGDGSDLIDLDASGPGSATITTGLDSDLVRLSLSALENGLSLVTIADFTTGTGGDQLDLSAVTTRLVQLGMNNADPFAEGRLRLTASGSDTLLEVDIEATGQFIALALLIGISPASLTSDNFSAGITPVVSTNPSAPQLDTSVSVLLDEDGEVELALTSPTDPDGGELSIQILQLPGSGELKLAGGSSVTQGQSLTSSELAGLIYSTTSNFSGTTAFRYTVRDDEGSVRLAEVTLTVQAVNDTPTITLSDQQIVDDGSEVFTLDLNALAFDHEDDDNLTITVQVNGGDLPAWLSYNADTGILSGVPPQDSLDILELSITITDPEGLSTTRSLLLSAADIQLNGTDNADTLQGGSGQDTLLGGGGDDSLTGGRSDDLIDGGAGSDTLIGGLGNDTYVVDVSTDVISETSALASEIDTVQAAIGWTLGANLEKLILTGANAINGNGNGLANTLTGNAAANTLNGGAGSDTLIGGLGNDTYVVDVSTDVISETSALASEIDTVQAAIGWTLGANLEKLILTGANAINGNGNGLANTLTGNAAANTLNGGAGSDTLTGGGGADRFVLDNSATSDLIKDFLSGTDKLVLDNSGLGGIGDKDALLEGALLHSATGGFSKAAELVVFNSNISGSITTASAAAKIGSATSAYAIGDSRIFAVDNGSQTAVYQFKAVDADAAVESNELKLLGTLGSAQTAIGDYLFQA